MSARAIRWVVIIVCISGIAGMIIGSIADNNAIAMTFGIVTAMAILCLMVATAVANASPSRGPGAGVEDQARRVEALVRELVAAGNDEPAVRSLVREAVRLGRQR